MEDSTIVAMTKTPEDESSSESQCLDKLYSALAKAQIEMLPAKTGSNKNISLGQFSGRRAAVHKCVQAV